MNKVIDASVLIKFYVPEILFDRAEDLFGKAEKREILLIAPDLIYPETGNILWKKHRLKELTAPEVDEIIESIESIPIRIEPSKPLLKLAVDLALVYKITVYDALYLAIAQIYESKLITADKRLTNVLKNTSLEGNIAWLGDM